MLRRGLGCGRRSPLSRVIAAGQSRARSAVCQAGGGKVMAEPAARHLSLPSGLLELCALLGASQDSLRGLEQVRGDREN